MAIETQCPHCKKAYRLKDELAGKRVTCGNPDCRKAFTVDSKASANGKAAEPRIDAEAAAAAIFGDEPVQAQEDQRKIAMTCATCETKWDVPWSMQGKNVLCPDCRARQRVPEQKTGKVDWRDSRAGRPTLARVEELEGVVGTVDVRQVSGKSLMEAGVIKEDIEPRPRWHYVAWAVTALALVGVLTYGVMLVRRSGKEDRRDQFMADALKDVLETKDAGLPPAEAPLFRAGIRIAAGEFALRRDDPEGLKAAIDHFAHARRDLEAAPPSVGRDLMLSELALAQVALGGPAEQVAAGTRVRWTPGGGRQALNEKTYTVQQELQSTLKSMATASADVRFHTVRRLARELARAGHPDVLSHSLIAQVMPQEHAEAVAQVAVEVLKATGDQARAKAETDALAPLLAATGKGAGLPPSAPALFQAVGAPAPADVKFPAPPGGGDVTDETRQTFVTQYLLQGKADEALDLAKKPGGTDAGRLAVLALAAEWADNPGPAVEAARAALPTGEKRRKVSIPDLTLMRLAAQAGRANQPDMVEAFVKSISSDAYRAWARAEALRLQLAASGEKPGEEAQAEAPANPKNARVGHAWGRLALARHNARVTGNDPDASVQYDGWGAGTFRPYGLAGLALGLQDRNK